MRIVVNIVIVGEFRGAIPVASSQRADEMSSKQKPKVAASHY